MISKTIKIWLRQLVVGWLMLICAVAQAGPPEHTTASHTDEAYVKITRPINKFQTNQAGISVTIEYWNIQTLTLNDNPITVNAGTHSVTVTYFLIEGLNSLTAVGKTQWSQTSDTIQVVLDTHAPHPDFHPAIEERKATAGLEYTFDAQIAEQDFTPNEYQFRLNGEIKQAYSLESKFHYTPEPTETGNKTLTVEVRDIGGEASQDIGIYVYRNPS